LTDEWPAVIRSLVQQYGAEQVWRAGLAVFGYPPTWTHRFNEVSRLQAALEEESKP